MKKVREVTKRFNPKHNAIWTFESLYEMMSEWCYEIYDKQIHSTLTTSPRIVIQIDYIKLVRENILLLDMMNCLKF